MTAIPPLLGNVLRPVSSRINLAGMIASFPMYDRPETRPAWDAFWSAVASQADGLPNHLTWDEEASAHWTRDDLVISQTCSLPYRTRLHGKVTLLGAFDFDLPGCAPGYYNSVLLMRRDDPRQTPADWSDLTLAYNAPDSQSGWAAPYFHATALGTRFANGYETGAHHASAIAVAEGRADIAALDAQTHRLLMTYEPDLMAQLIEIDRTAPTPGLPVITGKGREAIGTSDLQNALETMPMEVRSKLGIRAFVPFDPDEYVALSVPPAPQEVFSR